MVCEVKAIFRDMLFVFVKGKRELLDYHGFWSVKAKDSQLVGQEYLVAKENS